MIEILAALLERERTGRGARIVVSMTHEAHRFVAHRLAGEPVPRLLTGGAACYRDLRDGRRPASDRRRARAEVLAQPLRPARAARPRRPRVRARAARARGALPHADARRVARAARGQGHLRGTGADARRGGAAELAERRSRRLAFALAGHPCRRAPRPAGRLRARLEPGRRADRLRHQGRPLDGRRGRHAHARALVANADQPAWSPNGRRLAFTRGGCGLHRPRRRRRRAAARARRASRVVAERRADRARPRRHDRHAPLVRRRRAHAGTGSDPAYAPDGRLAVVRDGEIVAGGRASSTRERSRRGRPTASTSPTSATTRSTSTASRVHRGAAARLAARRSASQELLPDFDQRAADRPRDRRRARPLAARLHVARRQHRPRPEHLVGVRPPGAKRMIGTQRVLLANGKWRTYRRRRADPLHELAAAPSLAPDALRLVRAAHARRDDARARPQERLLPRRPLGRGARALAEPPAALPRRLRAVPPGGDARR